MEKEAILSHYQKTLEELKRINDLLNREGKIDLSDDKLYLGITFVSKIAGLNSLFSEEFIKEYNIEPMVKWIDKKLVMIQATHYSDKNLFFEFFNVIYPQLKYRFDQIQYYESLSIEDRKHLLITDNYHVYLYRCLKYYLEYEQGDYYEEIKELLSIINLYRITKDPDIVALGSKITYMDSLSNTVKEGRIVISSHADSENKLPLNKYKGLIAKRKNDVAYIDFSTSYFIRILDIDNSMEN